MKFEVRPYTAPVTITQAELDAVPPMPDLAEQRYRELMDQARRDLQPETQAVGLYFEQLAAEHKALKDFETGKPLKLADGRTLIRAPNDPDKAYVLPKPPSIADMLRDFPIIGRRSP